MHPAAIPIVLLAFLIGSPQVNESPQPRETGPEPCPTWLYEAPQLGPGRPQAVELRGLKEVSVCRYFGNAQNTNGPGLPPNDKLATERVIIRPRTARSLARAFNRLRPYPLQDAPYPDGQPPMLMCSPAFGGGFYLRFLYSDARQSSVAAFPDACSSAFAGKKGGWLLLAVNLSRRLERIAPLPQGDD
jgi:hypothetical protein